MNLDKKTAQKKMIEDNKMHLAEMYIHKGDIENIVGVLTDIEPLRALEFLYHKAHHYRHLPTPNHAKVSIIIEVSKMINRKRPAKNTIQILQLEAQTPDKITFKETRKLTPAEIFELNIAEFSI